MRTGAERYCYEKKNLKVEFQRNRFNGYGSGFNGY
jgi:hypothetical protein